MANRSPSPSELVAGLAWEVLVEAQGRRARLAHVVVLAAGLATAAPQSIAQAPAVGRGTVRGNVHDEAGRAVVGARLTVIGASLAGESDGVGAWSISNIPVGSVQLAVRRIGFAPETLNVRVDETNTLVEALGLRRIALPLQAVVVHGRRDLRGPMAGFYARLERGHGRFLTQEQIDRSTARRMSDLLRGIPGLRIDQRRFGNQSYRLRGATIAPLVWLDGIPMGAAEVDLDNFDPRTFAGIEIYSGAATVPVEFAGSRTMSTSGGSIVLWTRQGEPSARRRKKDDPSPALLVLGLLDRDEAFTRDEVDTQVLALGSDPVVPLYPDSLYGARIPGHVEVEFVVDPTGRPRMDTFGVVAATHPALGEAVRRAIEDRRFVPATRGGVAVAQVVQQPYSFRPDSGTRPATKPDN